jgi:DNA-binding response OmpR family regulator
MSKTERIGDVLVKRGLLDRDTVEAAARECAGRPMRIASWVVERGYVGEREVLQVLSSQWGVPAVEVSKVALSAKALSKVPAEVARHHTLFPMALEGGLLHLAMADPAQPGVREEVRYGTGCDVLAYVALQGRIRARIDDAYARLAKGSVSEPDSAPLPIVPYAGPAMPPLALPILPPDPVATALLEPVIAQPATTTRAGSDQVILVVEDESVSREMILSALASTGCTLVAAADGLSALQLVKERAPVLVVLDAMLPQVHGFEICRKIKSSKRFANVPVLMISATYRGWQTVAAIKQTYGADGFMEKPFSVKALRETVDKLLQATPGVSEAAAAWQAEADAPYFAGVEAYQAGHLETALTQFKAAERIDPFSAKIQFLLGQTLERAQQPFRAIYHYERAVELHPDLFAALKALAQLYQSQGFSQRATSTWRRAKECAPTQDMRQKIQDYLVKTA